MFAVLGVFAVSVSESANAQTVSAAVGQVYSEVGMVTVRYPDRVDGSNVIANRQVDGSLPVDDVWTAIDDLPNIQTPPGAFVLVENGAVVAADSTVDGGTGLPTFNGAVMMTGDIVRFADNQISTINEEFHYTVRIFTDGTDIFMARGEGESAPAVVAISTAATLAANEFFIRESDWMTVTALESGVVGFEPVQCEMTHLAAADEIMCDFRTAAIRNARADKYLRLPMKAMKRKAAHVKIRPKI